VGKAKHTQKFREEKQVGDKLQQRVKELEEKNHQLQQLQLSLTEELKRANTELEQFASMASHDLREPLRAVVGCLQLLENKHEDKLDDQAKELISHSVQGSLRMHALIDDLLSLSRVSTSTKVFELVNLSNTLDKAVNNLGSLLKESQCEITHDPLPSVMVDSAQFIQLFQNILGNSIKFHSNKHPKIHIGTSKRGTDWVLSMHDNGIGFGQEDAERIFQPFKRLHARDQYPGTGIGLAICKKIIERHGGTIWAESEPGQGATFYFTIAELGRIIDDRS